MQAKPRNETSLGKEIVSCLHISVDKHVFPRDECSVQNENRIVLVQPAGERVIKRTSYDVGREFIGPAANEFQPRRVAGNGKYNGKLFGLQRNRSVMGNKSVVRERRSGSHDFRAADN